MAGTIKPKIDWDAVEAEYSKGTRSNLDIAAQYGLSEGAIRKRAKQLEWTKDLSAKIRLKAEEKVRAAEYEQEYEKSTIAKISDRDIVDKEAERQSLITLSHRKDVHRARGITQKHFEELEVSGDLELRERVTIGKMLTESLKTQIALEREAYGIEAKAPLSGVIQLSISPMDARL